MTLSREEVLSNLDQIVWELKKLDADLLFLQEVDFHSARTFQIDQMEYLAKGLQMPFAAYVMTWNKSYVPWPYWPPKIHFGRMVSGQAILSRFPMERQEVTYFEKPAENAFWYNWFYPDRAVQKVILKNGDKKFAIWNVHLESFHAETRKKQIEKLSRLVIKEEKTLFVAGDFNERPGPVLNIFEKETNLKRGSGSKPIFSFSSWDPHEEIDYIYFSKNWRSVAAGNLPLTASDHLPVWSSSENPEQ